MDLELFVWFNHFNGQIFALDFALYVAQLQFFKSGIFMVAFWMLWFWPDYSTERTERRNSLAAVLLLTIPIIGITRALANYLPYSPRPIHTPGLEIALYDGQDIQTLERWSSMPSDHASLFMGIAVGLFTVHRVIGSILILWAVFVSSIPRVIWGLHWPSDVLVGWLLGAVIVLVLIVPVTKLIRRTNIVPFFEKREVFGYPLLFLATFEVAQMFDTTRALIRGLI